MTQNEIMKAYFTLRPINEHKMKTALVAKKVFELMNILQPYYDFQMQEEQKIYQNYPDLNTQTMTFDGDLSEEEVRNKVNKVNAELAELGKIEADVNFEKFAINAEKEGLEISGADIAALNNFIDFE